MLRRTISQVVKSKFNYRRNTFANYGRYTFAKLWEKYFCEWSPEQKFVPMKEFVCGGLEVISVEGSGWLLAPTPPEFN